MHIFRYCIGLLSFLLIYLYDDVLWGPAPLAIANSLLGWPMGALLLGALYFCLSLIISYAILKHFLAHPAKINSRKKWLNIKTQSRRGWVYRIVLSGRWLGLAVSCFSLGAIATSLIVGRFQLFKEYAPFTMALINSTLFVFLFLGFYMGIFTTVLKIIDNA